MICKYCDAVNSIQFKNVQDLTSFPILQRHHTSISPSDALLSPGYADSLPSLPMSQSHMSRARNGTVWNGMSYRDFHWLAESIPVLVLAKNSYWYVETAYRYTVSKIYINSYELLFITTAHWNFQNPTSVFRRLICEQWIALVRWWWGSSSSSSCCCRAASHPVAHILSSLLLHSILGF